MSGCVLAMATALLAHNPDTSYARVTIAPERLQTRLTYDIFTLLTITPLDDDGDGRLTRGEFAGHVPAIERYLREHIGLATSEEDDPADLGELTGFVWPPDIGEAIPAAEYHSANGLIHFDFARPLRRAPEDVAIAFGFFERFGERHSILGVFVYDGEEFETTFRLHEPEFTYVTGVVHDTSPGETATEPRKEPTGSTSLWERALRFFWLGVEHIFLGYDHICFLMALLVVSRFREVVKIVTSFTIAHSITLILAALDVVRLPGRFVETSIAATIVYVAVENLWILRARAARKAEASAGRIPRWLLTFCFGLVHGFGFAGVLRELGLPASGLVRCLLAFNVGVEAGQLAIATALLPVASLLARWKHGPKAVWLISAALALFGLAWFFDRALVLEMMPF